MAESGKIESRFPVFVIPRMWVLFSFAQLSWQRSWRGYGESAQQIMETVNQN